ncbi:hypothetical protein EV147_4738 [Cupriavidus agavae]|uniref:Uncharacterized protein n=2 Tax=Cupriavidus agavae TaxID=1001822 RepID=A0A4Q7RFN7_9BURK|nr:hypothetical protein [Cupriavidus agavae]RZT30890.1 hypothetical protein EV147_4738 [Cupriavidus agavae]
MFQTFAPSTHPAIVRDIDAAMLRRREEYAGQPMAWKIFCEASHVATLGDLQRQAFVERVANERGADAALRLKAKAEAIRAEAIARLM